MPTTYVQLLPTSRQVVLDIHHRHKSYGNEVSGTKTFDATHYVSSSGWLFRAVSWLAESSVKTPPLTSTVQALRSVLAKGSSVPLWREVVCLDEEQLTVEKLVRCYRLIDGLYPQVVSRATHNSLGKFRAFIRDYLAASGKFSQHSKLYRSYKSQLKVANSSRGTISDMIDYGGPIHHPIDALPHSNHDELLRNSLKKRQATLERLEHACEEHFQEFRKNRDWLQQLQESVYPEAAIQCVKKSINAKFSNTIQKSELQSYTAEIRLGICLQLVHASRIYEKKSTRDKIHFSWFSEIQTVISERIPNLKTGFWPTYFYPFIGDGMLLYTCALRIQLKTSWNIESILNLRASSIEKLNSGIFVQSVKRKTDDKTPPVLINLNEIELIFVVDFLLARHQFLFNLGLQDMDGLLFSSGFRGKKVIALAESKKSFQIKNQLPRFSHEQVRNEVLAYTAAAKGPKVAAELAGHAGLNSISGYSEDDEKKRLNSATNLEFQRRIDRDIRSSLEISDLRSANWPNITRVGDGASCVDPALPPNLDWLAGEVCKAEDCHSGTGCQNRKIIVNETVLKELAATVEYYEESWQRLISENPSRFEKIHFPRLVFAKSFEHSLSIGPYSSVYEKIKMKVKE